MVMAHLIAPLALATAINLIEGFEGVETQAYLDPVGIPTICAGLTRYPNGTPVRIGDVCNKEVCRRYLEDTLTHSYVPELMAIPGWNKFGPRRQAVLMSFAWNLGTNFYERQGFESISHVLRNGHKQRELYTKMPEVLMRYTKANGVELEGLKVRRQKEGELWKCEDDGVMEFKCLIPSFLKKAPIDDRYLSNDGRQGFEFGEILNVVAVEDIAEDSHVWVTLEGSNERWAMYSPHWQEVTARPSLDEYEKVDWGDHSAHVSTYLTVGEILQYDMRRRPQVGSKEEEELFYIAGQFSLIREAWGGPLGISSGYRPEPINAQVGGRPGSYHAKGMALDIYPVGESCSVFYKWLSKRWTGGLGDGCSKGFVHVDTRDDGEFVTRAGVKPCCIWSY